MQVIKQTANIAAKQDAGTDVAFELSGMTITHATGLPVGLEEQGALSTTATALTTTPSSGTSHVIGSIKITNTGASTRVVTFYKPEDGSTFTAATQWGSTISLLTLEAAEWTGTGWIIYDANGVAKMSVISPIAAAQADQESASNLTTFVSPGRAHFHPSATKVWGKATVSGAVPTLAVSYNTTSITDTATDRLTVTIATDFSSANYSVNATIEAATTTLSATTTSLACFIRFATLAAGAFEINACEFDIGVATDPASWMWQGCGDL